MKTDIKYLAIFSAIILATQLEAAQATRPGIQAPKPRHIISAVAQIHLRAAPIDLSLQAWTKINKLISYCKK